MWQCLKYVKCIVDRIDILSTIMNNNTYRNITKGLAAPEI